MIECGSSHSACQPTGKRSWLRTGHEFRRRLDTAAFLLSRLTPRDSGNLNIYTHPATRTHTLTATRHFTFDLTGALARQLEAAIPGLTQAPLTLDALEEVQASPGIYQLYLRGELIYIGKADKSLRARLTEHHKKISGRLRISIEDMSFTGLYLEGTWIPVGPEQMLINARKTSDWCRALVEY